MATTTTQQTPTTANSLNASATPTGGDKKLNEFLDTIGPAAKDWKYIEFRCMIQDILGNEIYSRHDDDNKLSDRTIFYCITIPGENEWVRQQASNSDGLNKFDELTATTSTNADNCDQDRLSISLVNYSFPIPDGKNKSCLIKVYDVNTADCLRVNDIVQVAGLVEPIEFEDDAELLTNKNNSPHNGVDTPAVVIAANGNNHHNNGNNHHHHSNNSNSSNNIHQNLNSSNSQNSSDQLSSQQQPQQQQNNGNSATSPATVAEAMENDFEPAKDFPERLVPRIHVKLLKKLPHINPLLPQVIDRQAIDVTRIRMAHARLTTILKELLGGDSLMAEYLIFSMISRIHRRKEVSTLGQLTVGLTGFTPEMKFLVEKLYEIICKVTTHSHYIDLSIANLNNLRFTPTKDIENNKMIAGTLQLPDGLFLMLNETALGEGLLTSQGTSNLSTLNHIIRWQQHKYDFQFHSVEIDTDLKILVISEGKSLLPVPVSVRIEKNDKETVESMRQACSAVDDFLTEQLLEMFRYYITSLMHVPDYKIPDDIQSLIASEYANWRKEDTVRDRPLFTPDDLSTRMTLARYLTIARGETELTLDIWQDICRMETARLSRLQQV